MWQLISQTEQKALRERGSSVPPTQDTHYGALGWYTMHTKTPKDARYGGDHVLITALRGGDRRIKSSRPALATEGIQDHPGLHEILSQDEKVSQQLQGELASTLESVR